MLLFLLTNRSFQQESIPAIPPAPDISLPTGPPPDIPYNPPLEPYLTEIHRDEQILLLDKPSGLLSVPGKPLAHRDCLETRAAERYPGAQAVHRLDRDTSGLILMARNKEALRRCGLAFERRQVKKRYIALIWGKMAEAEGEIAAPMRCDWPNRPRQMIDHEQGKPARTRWRVLTQHENWARVSLRPLTGRSHQLRLHMAALGHPMLGDRIYAHEQAFRAAPRLLLHAETLALRHPDTGRVRRFRSPCPF